jgi:glutamine synthetase
MLRPAARLGNVAAMAISPDELRAAVGDGEIDTVQVAFTDHYGRLVGKRLDAEFFCDEALARGSHACDYLLTVDMEMEPVPGYAFASWEQGYGDVHLEPDLTTLRRAAWSDRAAIVLCDVIDVTTHESVAVAPRSILCRQVERLAERDLVAMAGSELEFFVFDDTYRDAHERGYDGLRPAGWYIEDYHLLQGSRIEPLMGATRRALSASGIPVESTKGEFGHGQHEINVRFANVLEMADRHTILKHAMKEIADGAGRSLTFMAKPDAGEAGSSCHLHLSLWDPAGERNLFDDDGNESDLFRWFLAGWIAHVADFMVCYAPTVNSYKRYVDGSWAPTRRAWSHDNRTAGFRVVGSGPSLRIECRIPGADCNPYLAYAATIASGLAGIDARLEPPDELRGDVYRAQHVPRVARTLEHAAAGFAASDLARSAFGDDVVDHYAHFHDVEVAAYHAAVTDWERSRYFERI